MTDPKGSAVTDRLRLNEDRYRSFVDNSTEGIWCMEFGDPLSLDLAEEDLVTEIYDRAWMVEANDAFAQMYGFDSTQEMGKWRLKDFLPLDSTTMEMIRTAVRSDFRVFDLETVETDREGNSRVFLNNLDGQIQEGKLLRIWGTQRDATASRVLEEQMRLQAAAIEALDSGCIIVDARAEDMPIVYVNAGFTKMTGYLRSEVLGHNCRFLQGTNTDPETRRAIRDAIARGEAFDGEILNYRKDGKPFWNHLKISPVRNESGEVIHFVGTQADVTRRRQREAELGELTRQLAHAVRLGTMGELTAAIAHEISQPLTAIASNARAARRFLAGPDPKSTEIEEILDDIVADDERAAAVMQRIRALLTPQEVSRGAHQLEDLILEAVELLQSEAILKNVVLEVDLEEGLPPVFCDGIQVQQVVINLIKNGCEAMEEVKRDDARLDLRATRDGTEEIRVSLQDSGPGLGKTRPDDLFTPFTTTKRNGMGMGLSISRTIIESHGGRIWGCENPSRGATFHFTLPIAAATKDHL